MANQQGNNAIYHLYYQRYPYPFRFGSYLAIIRSLAIKHLVKQLYQQSRLSQQTYQRLMRTRQLIRLIIYFGLDSEKGQAAIATINRAHRGVNADNDAFRYVLSTFFLEPFRWNQHFQQVQISAQDQQRVVDFWCAVGERMRIKALFRDKQAWLLFQQQYEAEYMAYSQEGQILAKRTINELVKQAAPFGLRTLSRQILTATVAPEVQSCLHLSPPLIPKSLIMWLLNNNKINFEPAKDIVNQPLK